MNRISLLVCAVSATALTACTSIPVADRDLPGPETANAWQASSDNDGMVRDGWLDELNMPQLSQFVTQVLDNNPDYRSTALLMEAASYDRGVAAADLYPSLSGSFGAQRQHTSNPSVTENALSLGLDASWELDVWGRLSAQEKAAASDYAVARYDLEGARLSLAAQVAQSWFQALEAEQQYALARRTVESYERSERIIRNRFNRGLSDGLDLRLALSNLEAARASLSDRRDQLDAARRALEVLAGRYPAGSVMADGAIPDELPEVPAGLPAELLERRPDLQAAKQRLYAAGYRSQQADKALLPSFSLTGSAGNTSDNFSDLLKFDNIFWNLIGGITQPIFQGGRLHYNAKAQEARFEAQKEQFAQTLLQAFREVEDGLSSDRSLHEQVLHTAKAAEAAVSAEEVAIDQYSRGLINVTTLLDSQRQALAQQSQLLLVKRLRINNRIRLHLALGGDFTTTTMEDHQATNSYQQTAYEIEGDKK
ncbi:efflux transporter outer membrane subunit [Emcibacter nanhaiensis]|uniref:Efflux transporter outer membrane subunit n=1 Tax=Emcibacter nanhaiensis TaxID=1505037 RepID=A0A501PPK1_9PROT|nr:efflux transporter outer membrane subunit [Emcibacter nanhaiensis]TPD61701.1 efflux transporter outer membrane subunit [Emcibacter nanhaiensis]